MKFAADDLEQEVPFATSGGEEIKLRVRRLGRVEKVDAATAISRGDLASAEAIVLRSVTGWKGITNKAGADLKFTHELLDKFLGSDDVLGKALSKHLFESNGLIGEEPPLDQANG